jgi:hypothetical protein
MRVEARKKTEIVMGKRRKEAPDFSKFVEEFLTWSQAQNKASTHKRYRVSSKPLLKFFRGKVSEIDVASVERFKVARLKECSTAGVNRDLAALRYMMNFAITLLVRISGFLYLYTGACPSPKLISPAFSTTQIRRPSRGRGD